jgi:hypothetical protein
LRDLEQVELRLPHGDAAARRVVPDDVGDRVRDLKLLGQRVGRVELRIADERVLVGREHREPVDARVLGNARDLEVRGRNERAADRNADARVEMVEPDAELVRRALVEGPRVAEGRAPVSRLVSPVP